MADAQRTIDLIFNGVDKTGAATLSALNNVGKFAGNVQGLTQPIADFTLSAVKLEGALLASGLALTTFAVKAAGDFDSSFRQISTLVDASAEDLGKFRQAILDYATSSNKPLADITASLSAAIGSGVAMGESLELLAVAEKLAVATRADLTSTTETLVSTLNAYGLKTSDAGKVSDLFFQTIKDGKIEMTDLSASLARVTPIAATAGISLQEVGAVIATLTAGGVQPASAIDALRSAISNIIKPSEQAKKLAEELGIEFNVQALQSKGLAGVLGDVAKATGGSADKMAILFGDVTGLGAVLSLTGKQADTFKEALVSMGAATGAVNAAFDKMAADIGLSTQKAANAFKVLLVAIGDPLLNEFSGVANAIAAIFAALGVSVRDGALKNIVAYIEKQFGDLQGVLAKVAANLPKALESANLSGFTGGIQAVVEAFKRLFSGIDLTTVAGLTRAVELAGAAFLGLSRFTAGVVDSFKPLFDFIVKLGSQIDQINPAWLQFAGNVGGAVTQFNAVLGGVGGLVSAFEALLTIMVVKQGVGLVGAMAELAGGSAALATKLGSAGLVAAAGAAGYAVGTSLKDPIDRLISSLTGSETTLGGWIYDLVHSGGEVEKFGGTVEGASKKIEGLTEVIADVGESTSGLSAAAQASNRTLLNAAEAAASAAGATQVFGAAQKDAGTYTMKIVEIVDEATGKIVGYTQELVRTEGAGRRLGESSTSVARDLKTAADVMDVLGFRSTLTNKELIELAKNVKDAEIKLEELASNERIKYIEAQVSLNIAQLEADTERVKAAFASIDSTVNSTQEALGDMFKLLAGDTSFTVASDLRDQIDAENRRRDGALKLQGELTRAQIDNLKAQTRQIDKGDAMIKIDGGGLQPHLEGFMFEILRAIQVRVNQDGLKMLLGS